MWIRHITLLGCLVLGVVWAQQSASAQHPAVAVVVRCAVHGKPCVPGAPTTYATAKGQAFTVSTLRFYIGHIALKGANQTQHILADHVLIDAEDTVSGVIPLQDVPPGTYRELSFMVGVDSIHNTGGPLEGALDPLNGMYWTWATGFIFVKLEGTSPLSQQPKHQIEYHLGGFAHPYQHMRWVTLRFSKPLIVGNIDETVTVTFDVGAWLDACNIDLATQPTVTDVRSAGPMMDHISSAFRANR